jgi:hypothetical protein
MTEELSEHAHVPGCHTRAQLPRSAEQQIGRHNAHDVRPRRAAPRRAAPSGLAATDCGGVGDGETVVFRPLDTETPSLVRLQVG